MPQAAEKSLPQSRQEVETGERSKVNRELVAGSRPATSSLQPQVHTQENDYVIGSGIYLGQGISIMAASLGDTYGGIQSMSRVHQMLLQWRLLKQQMGSANMECSPLCKYKRSSYNRRTFT
ncbi:hypothetical protein LSAT2_026878 [Lamellibrachia satsuma]|nr:hypothetical protein LSAT2_026878 [Lamellibrachia satsuma]